MPPRQVTSATNKQNPWRIVFIGITAAGGVFTMPGPKSSVVKPPSSRETSSKTNLTDLQVRSFGSKTIGMAALNDYLLKSVEQALAGKWDAAHELIQQYEDDATAAWIHAVLHKIEGDLGNARYWYRHADRMNHVGDEPRAELATIQVELRSRRGV
jgi:hypothetical protein